MKKITLLVTSIFVFGGSIANAAEKIDFSVERRSPADFRNAEPIVFIERGIEFFIFPDGQLDFNTRPANDGDMYYRSNFKGGTNRTYGAPMSVRNANYGVKVEHDNMGRVRQIGNVFINYDAYDRIKRVGSVYMTYNRYALERVGGLQIVYNHRGQIVDTFGTVNGSRVAQFSQNNVNNNSYGYGYGNNQNSNNQDDYYYKTTGPKVKKQDNRVAAGAPIRIERRN